MTEVSERLEKLINQLENFENHETGDLDIDDVKQDLNYIYSLMQDDATDYQPTFAVGEYYADDHGHIVRIDKIIIGHITASKLCDGQITQTAFTFWLAKDVLKPATAEQIKEFKLAEAIANTGQSSDQIRQMLSSGKMPMGPWLALRKTAEELQEVEK